MEAPGQRALARWPVGRTFQRMKFGSQLAELGYRALDALERTSAAQAKRDDALRGAVAEPPVVARFMVEIRSDGSQTIARGALEDHLSGESHTVEARASTPALLVLSLARHLITLPAFQDTVRRALGK